MRDLEQRWLPVVSRLMGRVSPRDYIYNMEPPERGPRGPRLWTACVFSVGALLGASLLFVSLGLGGYRWSDPREMDALRVINRVDPDHEVGTDEELARRWGRLVEAYRVLRTAVASPPSGELYPYLATLSGHPPPAIDPGVGPAVVLLANALDLYPLEAQASIISRLIALAAVMDQPDVMAGLLILADLPRDTRQRLFADGARSFANVVEIVQDIKDERGRTSSLVAQLGAERESAVQRRKILILDTANLKAAAARDGRIRRACARHLDSYIACLPENPILPDLRAPSMPQGRQTGETGPGSLPRQ